VKNTFHIYENRFFLYQLANVYLIVLAGSVFTSLSDALSDPSSVVTLLGSSLPGVSTFFLNLLLTYLFSGVPLTLLRLGPAAVYKIFRMLYKEPTLTRRALLEGPLLDTEVEYATVIPQFLYVLCIALTYWVIAPMVIFIAGLVFAANYVTYKYQLCYIIVNKVESGGMCWYKIFNYSMVGLMASCLTMVGFFGIKEGATQAPLLVPLPVIVLLAWRYMDEKFRVYSLNLTYSEAMEDDSMHRAADRAVAGAEEQSQFTVPSPSPSHPQHKSFFSSDFFQSPAAQNQPHDALPQVYRQGTIPLFDENGFLHEEYHHATLQPLSQMEESLGLILNLQVAGNGELSPMQSSHMEC
jgi:hypothetical protein